MALTRLSNAYVPHLYDSMGSINIPETDAFYRSGIAVTNQALLDRFNGGGLLVDLPAWLDLDHSVEPDYITDNPGDIAVPGNITSALMQARIRLMHKSFGSMNLVAELSSGDPQARIKERFDAYWLSQWQKSIIAVTLGVMYANILNNNSDMVVNIAAESTGAQSPATMLANDDALDALYTAGDQAQQFTAVAMHSIVEKNLKKQDLLVPLLLPSGQATGLNTYLGKIVTVDDDMPVIAGTTSGYKYVTAFFGPGAIGYAIDGTATIPPSYVDTKNDTGNGGGQEVIGERKRMIVHPFGHKWTENTVTGQSPSYANLKLAANWQRVAYRKQIPMAFIITNG